MGRLFLQTTDSRLRESFDRKGSERRRGLSHSGRASARVSSSSEPYFVNQQPAQGPAQNQNRGAQAPPAHFFSAQENQKQAGKKPPATGVFTDFNSARRK